MKLLLIIAFGLVCCRQKVDIEEDLIITSPIPDECIIEKNVMWKHGAVDAGYKLHKSHNNLDFSVVWETRPIYSGVKRATVAFSKCEPNYFYITSFDDNGNESSQSDVLCFGEGCPWERKVMYVPKKKKPIIPSKLPAPAPNMEIGY